MNQTFPNHAGQLFERMLRICIQMKQLWTQKHKTILMRENLRAIPLQEVNPQITSYRNPSQMCYMYLPLFGTMHVARCCYRPSWRKTFTNPNSGNCSRKMKVLISWKVRSTKTTSSHTLHQNILLSFATCTRHAS